MSDMMIFPETWEEFEKSYGFDDREEIYTNGSRLIPSFRVKQWLDHESKQESKRQATVSSDCIYRQQALDAIRNIKAITGTSDDEILLIDKAEAQTELMMLPSAQQCMTATSNTMVSETVKIPVMDGTTERLPSAEPERKKGKWEYFSENIDGLSFGIKRCSMCGASKPMKLFHWEDTEINFCPNCGADMREDT